MLLVPNGFEANFTVGFAKGLAANGLDFVVLSCPETHQRLMSAGIRCVNLIGQPWEKCTAVVKMARLLTYYARLAACLVRHRGGVIHFIGIYRNTRILEGLIFCALFRVLSRRFVYTVHNVLPHGGEKSRLLRALYRLLYMLPNVLIVHTRRSQEQLASSFFVPRGKVTVSSIGLNEETPESSLTAAEARQQLGFRPDERVILFFGKLEPYKGLDLLISAFDRLKTSGTRLVIAGRFTRPGYRDEVLAAFRAARRASDIQLHERFLPNEEVETFFKGCDVLAMPYRNIYQSGLLFLCMRFGLPVVATDVGSLREYVEEDLGVVSGSNDAAGFAAALEEFFESRNRFERSSIRARSARYAWEAICRDLLPFYETEPAARSICHA